MVTHLILKSYAIGFINIPNLQIKNESTERLGNLSKVTQLEALKVKYKHRRPGSKSAVLSPTLLCPFRSADDTSETGKAQCRSEIPDRVDFSGSPV